MARIENNEIKPYRCFGRMVALSLLVALTLAGVGYWPTSVQAGADGVTAMFAALAICLLGGWSGLVPTMLYLSRPPREFPNGIMLGLAVRFAVTLGLALAAALTKALPNGPLLLWIGIAQLIILTVDVIGLTRILKVNARKAS